jgi:membrane protein
MVTQSDAVGFGKRIAADFSEKNVSFMAAALAYHAFISLAPLLLLLFLVFTTVGVGLESQLVQSAIAWLPGPIAELVTGLLSGDTNGAGASAIGLLVLVWGSLKIFRGLDTAFSEIYETTGNESLLDKFRDGFIVLFALAIALVAMVGSSVVLGALTDQIPFSQWLTPVALLAGLVVAFYPIYYVFPDVDLGVRDVLPGVVVAAVGWGALQGLFQVYLSVADPSTGSFFGGVIVVVTYLYFSALVLLLGAVVNAVVGQHSMAGPGGIGRAERQFTTERTASFDRAALLAYLADLRTELLTDRGTHRRTDLVGPRPKPTGAVELVEESTTEGEGNQWMVRLRWEFSDDELVEYLAARAGPTAKETETDRAVRDEAQADD